MYTEDKYHKVNRRQVDNSTARTRPGTRGGRDTGRFFKIRANRGLHLSRRESGHLKVIHHAICGVRLPSNI